MLRSTQLVVLGLGVVLAGCAGPALAPTAQPTDTTAQPTAPATQSPGPTAQPTAPATQSPGPTDPPATQPPPTSAPPPLAVAWTEMAPIGGPPEAREDHSWTVAGDRREAYLFGGRAGRTEFNDLWHYDLDEDAWTRFHPEGTPPAARFGHVAAWVDGIGLVIWSGQAGTRFFNDAWAYDPDRNAWRELPSAGDVPAPRYGSCGDIGPDGRLWISHGFTEDTGRFSDTRAYDFATGTWTDMTPAAGRPVERCLHDCLWTPDGRLLLYAGQTTGAPAIGDLWTYDAQTGEWTQAAQPEPDPRQLYAVAQLRGTAFIFGGGARDGSALADLWQLDLATLAWSAAQPPGAAPGARFGASLIADEGRDRLLLFGGKRGNRELADLWQLDVTPPG
jgi:hypothetical protein